MSIYGNNIFCEGLIDKYRENSKIMKEIEYWIKESRKLCLHIVLKRNIDPNCISLYVNMYDESIDRWKTSQVYNMYQVELTANYNTLKSKLKDKPKYISKVYKNVVPVSIEEFISEVRRIEYALYRNPSYIKKVEQYAKQGMKDCKLLSQSDFYPSIPGHPLVPELTAEFMYDDPYYISIFENHNQDVRIVMRYILYDIVDELQKNKKFNFDYDFGDGDEGCIYIDSRYLK